jgi:hypothetical protein
MKADARGRSRPFLIVAMLLAIVVMGVSVALALTRPGPIASEPPPSPSDVEVATVTPVADSTPADAPAITPGPADDTDEPEAGQPARPLLVPAAISARPTLPFCGHETVRRLPVGDVGEPDAWDCLLDALDAGRPAELVRDSLTIEGGNLRDIYRVLPSGQIEWLSDASQDAFGSGQWTQVLCGRLERIEPDPDAPVVHVPADCGHAGVLVDRDQPDAPSGDDMAMLEALVLFARTGDEGFLDDVPLSPDGVWLGLADQLMVRMTPEELRRPGAWRLAAEAFRGFTGPFSARDHLASWGPESDRDFVREASVTVGQHPHCASPPVPAPADVADLRRLSIQPVGELACPAWWTVDLFVKPGGAIEAITLDRYEP